MSAEIRALVESLKGLAEVNAEEWRQDPSLLWLYERAFSNTHPDSSDPWRLHWIPDRKTSACGRPNCWTPWSILATRLYPLGPVQIDCKGLASSHAAYLRSQGKPAWVGIRPGRIIAHALCGEGEGDGAPATILDPSVTAGMTPLRSYSGPIFWAQVKR